MCIDMRLDVRLDACKHDSIHDHFVTRVDKVVKAYIVMVYIGLAYIVMAYIVMVCIVAICIVMAYTVSTRWRRPIQLWPV